MSKQVADRESASRAVIEAIAEHRAAIASKHAELLADTASRLGKPVPDVGAMLEMYAEMLRASVERLRQAHAAHVLEGLDDAAPRFRRDHADRALRDFLSPMRKAVEGIFGDQGLHTLGLWEPLPGSVEVLRKYGEGVVDALGQTSSTLTPILMASGASFDRSMYLAGLRPLVTALSAALDEVAKESAELGGTQVAKDAAMRDHNASFLRIAGAVEHLARVVGLDELAQRIRPSASNPGVLLDTGEDLPTPEEPSSPSEPVKPGMPGADPFDPEEDPEE